MRIEAVIFDAFAGGAFLSLVEVLKRNGFRCVPLESEDREETVATQIEARAAGSLDEGDFGRGLVDWVRREDP